eukprot:1162992-Rhodomonas_salina.1
MDYTGDFYAYKCRLCKCLNLWCPVCKTLARSGKLSPSKAKNEIRIHKLTKEHNKRLKNQATVGNDDAFSACKTTLQSSWEGGGSPVYVNIIGSQRRGRAQYNRMVGVACQQEFACKQQPPETQQERRLASSDPDEGSSASPDAFANCSSSTSSPEPFSGWSFVDWD